MTVKFESLNKIILKQSSKKVSNEYHYIRCILQMQPDGTSNQIQRRLYVTLTATYDNTSPKSLPLYFVCYSIKNALKNNVDMTIYDFDKSFETVTETMKMCIPIDMNGFDILKTSHYLHGYLITNLSDKTFIINGGKRVLLSNNSIIKQIQIIYNTFKFNYKLLHTQIHYGFRLSLHDFFVSDQNTQKQTLNMNLTLQNGESNITKRTF